MTRDEAIREVKARIKTKNLIKHVLAVEAVMRRLATHFGEDPDRWGLAGVLHDLDYEETKDDPARHSLVGAKVLEEMGIDSGIVQAVRSHNECHGLPRETLMEKALYCSDPLTGLIVASALIHPDKNLAGIDSAFVLKRFDEKAFAKGANRETIRACGELGLELDDFVSMGLEAMRGIAGEIGL
jgi:putative nucleotidyltransferase with HDIG domain